MIAAGETGFGLGIDVVVYSLVRRFNSSSSSSSSSNSSISSSSSSLFHSRQK